MNNLQHEISKLVMLFPYGELLADTDPVAFMETVRTEIEESRSKQSLQELIERQRDFSIKTFGPPNNNTCGIIDHICKEIDEVAATEGKDLSEWIDIVILALDGAWRAGFTPEQIVQGLLDKQAKNESRRWPDWRTAEPGKAIEHIRDEHD